jgi:hypothetical protein
MVSTRLRALSFAALAAASAAVAHGGAAALTDPAWALPALGGATVATAVLLAGWRLVAARGERAAEASLALLIPAMLVAQGAAHASLLAAGAAAHPGPSGSLALHLALAVLAAVLVHRIDRHTVERAARALARPPAAQPAAARRPAATTLPCSTAPDAIRGRGPPVTA